MYECTISINQPNKYLLDWAQIQLQGDICLMDGILTSVQSPSRNYISVACTDTYRFALQRQICATTAHLLAVGCKNLYIRDFLQLKKANFCQDLLVNSLCVLDCQQDKQTLAKQIDAQRDIFLDGYYNFAMRPQKQKWKSLLKLVSENDFVLRDDGLVIEFLRYLLESAIPSVANVDICFNGDGFALFDAKGRCLPQISSLSPNFCAQMEGLLNVVWYNPKRLRVVGEASNQFLQVAKQLFDVQLVSVG